MILPPAPLPAGIAQRLAIILAKPAFRKMPRLAEAVTVLVRDACGARFAVIQHALNLAHWHQPVVITGATGNAYCNRCAHQPRWPCREAVAAAEILHALGHEAPYKLPPPGHPAYSPESSPGNWIQPAGTRDQQSRAVIAEGGAR